MIDSRIVSTGEITPNDKKAMYCLLENHFQNCSYRRFEADLAEKDGAILLYNTEQEICGFSTYLYYSVLNEDEQINIIFSGDTIIHKEYWGDSSLFKCFLVLLLNKMENLGGEKFYWFLISKGFRTYLLLPLFFRKFYPSYRERTPPEIEALLGLLAEKKFGSAFIKKRGIIKSQGDSLNCELSTIPENKLRNPHVRYFLEKNKNWHRGDELVCITEINYANFKGIVNRLLASVTSQ